MGNRVPQWAAGAAEAQAIKPSFFEYETFDLDGHKVTTAAFKQAKALMVFNVSSKCGLTKGYYPQMIELKKQLRAEYPESNFEILAFPCAQFAGQEFNTSQEIKDFLAKNYPEVNFPIFHKIDVNGKKTDPIFQFLKYNAPTMCDRSKSPTVLKPIGWNFGKFLLDGQGRVVKYYGPKVEPKLCKEDCVKVIKGELAGRPCEVPQDMGPIQSEDAETEGMSCGRIIAENKQQEQSTISQAATADAL